MWLFFCSLSWAGVPADYQPPAGFVDLQQAIPGIRIQAGYHSVHNFTGAPLPGYGVNAAWLHKKAAAALGKVQQQLTSEGLGLLVYDAYRPARATQAMMAWVRRTKQHRLVNQGYIAARSRHNHGVAVDLTLVSLEDGKPLDMGVVWDTFTKQAHTGNATGKILANRQKLAAIMKGHGFRAYHKEWWHFHYPISKTRARDVPYSCFEAKEGTWKAPNNWENSSYQAPQTWLQDKCEW